MTTGNLNHITISKSDFIESFVQLYEAIKQFDELTRLVSEDETENILHIREIIQNRLNHLKFGSVNVKGMEIIGAYLRFTLEKFKGDKLHFQIPDNPDDNYFSPNDGYQELSHKIETIEQELREIEEKVFFISRLLPPNNIEKIGLLLKAISSLFKSIVRKDAIDMESHINHIHHLTATKESYFVINDLGRVIREIYNSLSDFSSHVPIEDLDPSLVDDMPDAIDKLNLVIQRMENSANSTLDEAEGLLEKNIASKEMNSTLLEKCTQMQEKLDLLKSKYPEAAQEIDEMVSPFAKTVQKDLLDRAIQLQEEEKTYFNIISNQSFQDITGQTIKKIIQFIEQLEFSLLSILQKYSGKMAQEEKKQSSSVSVSPLVGIETGDGLILEGPQDNREVKEKTEGVKQADVDKMLAEFGF